MIKQILTTSLFLLGLLTVQVEAAQIISFNVTSPVENGTSSVILDCNFIFDPLEENLVMKWYFNDNPRPVYQWIIALKKRSYSEEIRRHIDPDFTVDNRLTEHRAIRLIRPTTQLSGNYKCTISSVQSSDSASAKLIVYAPAKSFSFRAFNDSAVLCRASGLYPSPVVDLYRLNSKHYKSTGPSKVKISKEGYTVITGEQGKYSIESSGSIDEADYNAGQSVHYQCHLSIPDTNYSVTRNLTLSKGWNQQKIIGKSKASSNKFNQSESLRSVRVTVPFTAFIGSDVSMDCSFDSEDDALYSLKWYHNGTEFISYRPSDGHNVLRVWELEGVAVDMDNLTNGSTIDLIDLNQYSQGVYKCEVVAEGSFQTDSDESYLQVVAKRFNVTLDEAKRENKSEDKIQLGIAGSDYLKPIIKVDRSQYHIGDRVALNCTLPMKQSTGKIDLKWLLPSSWDKRFCPYKVINHANDGLSIGLTLTIDNCHHTNGSIAITCKGVFKSTDSMVKKRLTKTWLGWTYSESNTLRANQVQLVVITFGVKLTLIIV